MKNKHIYITLIYCLLLTSCSSEVKLEGDFDLLSVADRIFLETDSDGSGAKLENLSIKVGEQHTIFCVMRDRDGKYVESFSASWISSGSIGLVTISSDGKSAQLEAIKPGSGEIQIWVEGKLAKTVKLTIKSQDNDIQNINVTDILKNSFNVEVTTLNKLSSSDSANFYYCNSTKIPNCNPKDWYTLAMTKNLSSFTVSTPSFKFPDDPKDKITFTVSLSLSSGIVERTQTVQLDGPAQIYRSIGVGSTAALVSRVGAEIIDASIVDSVINFTSAVPSNIGIGDAVVIDTTAGGGFEVIYFIRERISDKAFLLSNVNGEQLSSDHTSVVDWEIYRAYTSIPDTDNLTENTGIPAEVNNFDTSTDAVADNKAWHFAFYADAPWNLIGLHGTGNWTYEGDNFLRFYVPFLPTEVGVSQRHSGVWDATKGTINIQANSDYNWAFIQKDAGKNALRVEGFQFEIDPNGYNHVYALRNDSYQLSTSSTTYFHNNIIKGLGGGIAGATSVASASQPEQVVFVFANIAYNEAGEGRGFGGGGANVIISHNTAYGNDWNFYGLLGGGTANFSSNISFASSTYEFRGDFSVNSDYNIAQSPASFSNPPGVNSLLETGGVNVLDFADIVSANINLCTGDTSVALNFGGPKMILESDPFKIYYDAAGKIRNPNDISFSIGACTQ